MDPRWTAVAERPNFLSPKVSCSARWLFLHVEKHVSTCFMLCQVVSLRFAEFNYGTWKAAHFYRYTIIYIIIYIYHDSWCSHKLGRFSNNLERLHKSGSEALQPSLSETTRLEIWDSTIPSQWTSRLSRAMVHLPIIFFQICHQFFRECSTGENDLRHAAMPPIMIDNRW